MNSENKYNTTMDIKMTKQEAKELVENFESAMRDFIYLEEQLKISPDHPELIVQHRNAAYGVENYKMKMILELI